MAALAVVRPTAVARSSCREETRVGLIGQGRKVRALPGVKVVQAFEYQHVSA